MILRGGCRMDGRGMDERNGKKYDERKGLKMKNENENSLG